MNNPIAKRFPAEMIPDDHRHILDRQTKRQIREHVNKMIAQGVEAEIAAQVASRIYVHTLSVASQALTLAEVVKMSQSSLAPAQELDEIDAIRRREFLETLTEIGNRANQKLLKVYGK